MQKKTKTAQPVTEPDIKPEKPLPIHSNVNPPSIPVEPEVITSSPEQDALDKAEYELVQPKIPSPEDRLLSLELGMKQAENNFKTISEFLTKLEPLIAVSQQLEAQKTASQASGATAPGLPGGDVLTTILKEAFSSKQASNPLMDQLQSKILEYGMEQMTAGSELLRTMNKKLLSELGAKVVTDTVTKT